METSEKQEGNNDNIKKELIAYFNRTARRGKCMILLTEEVTKNSFK